MDILPRIRWPRRLRYLALAAVMAPGPVSVTGSFSRTERPAELNGGGVGSSVTQDSTGPSRRDEADGKARVIPAPADDAESQPETRDEAAPTPTPATRLRFRPARWEALDAMPMAVFDAAASLAADHLIVTGGFDEDLQTTVAIQLFQPDSGWKPVASALWEPRARHTQTSLPDGRALIIGGVQGSLISGSQSLRPLDSGEIIHPFQVRGARLQVDEPLIGHTVTTLPDGTVAVTGGASVRIFDPRFDRFVARIPLQHRRTRHAVALLHSTWADCASSPYDPPVSLIVMGGDEEGSIEEIDLQVGRSSLWETCLPVPVNDSAAHQTPDGRIWLAGGYDRVTGRSTDATWWLDVNGRTIEPGPSLEMDGGVAGHVLMPDPDGRRLYLVGGERREPGRVTAAKAGRVIDLQPFRLWAIPERRDEYIRRAWFAFRPCDPAAAGGYRYVAAQEDRASAARPGPSVVGEIDSLHVPPIAMMHD